MFQKDSPDLQSIRQTVSVTCFVGLIHHNECGGFDMYDLKRLEEAMGELDEEVVVEELKAVMEDGGTEAQQAMDA